MLVTLDALPIGQQRMAIALAPPRDPGGLSRGKRTVNPLSGVDRKSGLSYATVTGAANAHMDVRRRMVTEAEHDNDSLEARDPWHLDTLRRWADSLE
jgi:hypothetical protein